MITDMVEHSPDEQRTNLNQNVNLVYKLAEAFKTAGSINDNRDAMLYSLPMIPL